MKSYLHQYINCFGVLKLEMLAYGVVTGDEFQISPSTEVGNPSAAIGMVLRYHCEKRLFLNHQNSSATTNNP